MRKVLLVEDDKRFRLLLKRLLEKKFAVTVLEADDGLAGLELFSKEPAQMIFLDIDMPNMNGREFLEKIRSVNKTVPVVIMTNLSERDVVESVIKLDISDYLLKADYITQLSDRIEAIFSRNQSVFTK